ncbi:MAG: type II toxin-antitoxin system RelE/ParE family toxin [Rhodospirillales bacterium]
MAFPPPACRIAGHALEKAQAGDMHDYAKPLKGLGPGVLEIAFQHSGGAFRTVYAVRFKEAVYVLHAFQKKSKKGIATPKQEIDLVKRRLKEAERSYEQKYGGA